MKILLDIDGWRKESTFFGRILSGRVEIGLYAPLNILVARNEREKPIPETLEAIKVVFEYRGKNSSRGLPIFEYSP